SNPFPLYFRGRDSKGRASPPLTSYLVWLNYRVLLDNFCHNASADGTAAFADGEAQTFFHGDRGDQLDGDRHVVARHDHLGAFRQGDCTGHVGGAEVELRTVVGEERGVTTTFILGQHVDFTGEVG